MADHAACNKEYVEAAERQLQKVLAEAAVLPKLREAMWYSVNAGGKRLRPCLLLAACDMMEGRREAALPLAAAIEMIHTYSLIHDDLPCMDNDDFRRGRPTSHRVFGEANALLAGDGLLSLAFESLLAEQTLLREEPGYAAAVYAVAQGAGVYGMVAGQWQDLAATGDVGDEKTLRYIHSHKTGAMITAAVMAGALLGNGSAEELLHVKGFSESYGVLFQITDDILDVIGDFESMGKTLGKDAAQEKTTYVTLYGLERSRKLAAETAEQAKSELSALKRDSGYFEQLVDNTVSRKK